MKFKEIDKLAVSAGVRALSDKAAEIAGVELRYSNDVQALEQAHKELQKGGTGEHFRRALDTLPPNRFFWIGAYCDNEIVATVAARCDDVSWSLQEFVKAYWERVYQAADGSSVQISPGSPAAAASFAGRFVYLGEALTRDDYRSNGLSYVMVRLAMLFAFDEWRPSVVYGWMRDWHAYRGLAIRWGFNGCNLSAIDWLKPPAETDWHNLAFLTCDRPGFDLLLKSPVPEALFAKKTNKT